MTILYTIASKISHILWDIYPYILLFFNFNFTPNPAKKILPPRAAPEDSLIQAAAGI
tara:strand:+ start:92 stop:262 length:171 start_codon:yes stop_codon:yes gene_type:complete